MAEVPGVRKSIYDPLPSSTYIRLLRRLPTDEAAIPSLLRLYLEIYDLPLAPEFTALSYTWGPCIYNSNSSNEEFRVECNGQLLIVTENLFDFLESCGQDFLWIDALCINQEDLNERAIQVSMMGKIYAAANLVIMWLGKDTSDLEEFTFLHNRFLHEYDKSDISHSTQDVSLWDLPFLREIGIETKAQWREYWTAYFRFYYRRRFFYRAWIVQEVALSRKQVFACGSALVLLQLSLMNRLASYLQYGRWKDELEYLEIPMDKVANPLDFMIEVRGLLFDERLNSREFQVTAGGPESDWQKRTYKFIYGAILPAERWFCFLLTLVHSIRTLQATDPRDMIYSILGLANLHLPEGLPPPIVPNYHLSVREIYISVSAQILRSMPYLGLLSEAHDLSGRRNLCLLSLPSWVPNYASISVYEALGSLEHQELSDNDSGTEYQQRLSGPVYNASLATLSLRAFRDIQNDKLFVKGARFVKVEEVTSSFDLVFQPLGLFPFLKVCSSINPVYEATGQGRIEALWRTLIADFYEGQHPAPDMTESFRDYVMWILCHMLIFNSKTSGPEVVRQMVKHIRVLDELENENPSIGIFGSSEVYKRVATLRMEFQEAIDKELDGNQTLPLLPRGAADRFNQVVGERMRNRCIYRTADGYLGSGPASTKKGDEIWLIEGALVPFVMRPAVAVSIDDDLGDTLAPVSDTDENTLVLIGEAYLHGFMHGEMLTADLKERVGKICMI
jgi:hypothetical protein